MPTFVPDGAKDSAVHTLNRRKRPRRRHHLVLLVLPRDTRCGHDEDVCRVANARRRRHGAAVKEARVPRSGYGATVLVLVLVLKLVLVLLLEPLLWRGVEADAGIRCRGQGQACVGTTCKVEETTRCSPRSVRQERHG